MVFGPLRLYPHSSKNEGIQTFLLTWQLDCPKGKLTPSNTNLQPEVNLVRVLSPLNHLVQETVNFVCCWKLNYFFLYIILPRNTLKSLRKELIGFRWVYSREEDLFFWRGGANTSVRIRCTVWRGGGLFRPRKFIFKDLYIKLPFKTYLFIEEY